METVPNLKGTWTKPHRDFQSEPNFKVRKGVNSTRPNTPTVILAAGSPRCLLFQAERHGAKAGEQVLRNHKFGIDMQSGSNFMLHSEDEKIKSREFNSESVVSMFKHSTQPMINDEISFSVMLRCVESARWVIPETGELAESEQKEILEKLGADKVKEFENAQTAWNEDPGKDAVLAAYASAAKKHFNAEN